MVGCAHFPNSAVRKLPISLFPVLWYNLAVFVLAQNCKNSMMYWPLVLTQVSVHGFLHCISFFSGCFPSALICVASGVALCNSCCAHTYVFYSAVWEGLLISGNYFLPPWTCCWTCFVETVFLQSSTMVSSPAAHNLIFQLPLSLLSAT